jgi:hypothetical protein
MILKGLSIESLITKGLAVIATISVVKELPKMKFGAAVGRGETGALPEAPTQGFIIAPRGLGVCDGAHMFFVMKQGKRSHGIP